MSPTGLVLMLFPVQVMLLLILAGQSSFLLDFSFKHLIKQFHHKKAVINCIIIRITSLRCCVSLFLLLNIYICGSLWRLWIKVSALCLLVYKHQAVVPICSVCVGFQHSSWMDDGGEKEEKSAQSSFTSISQNVMTSHRGNSNGYFTGRQNSHCSSCIFEEACTYYT